MSTLDRLMVALKFLVHEEVPEVPFLGTYEYEVQTANGQAVDVVPTDPALKLPGLGNLPLFPSVFAESISGIQVGQTCLVRFVDGNPGRPEVISFSAISGTSTVDATGSVTLGSSGTKLVKLAGGTSPVVRQGDQVTCIVPLPAPPPVVSGIINGSIAFSGTVSGLLPGAAGIVTGSNPNVNA